jgi:branched-chain amino acid transport system substrate-binding protein
MVLIVVMVLSPATLRADEPGKQIKIGVLTSITGPFAGEGGEHGCIGCSQAIANGAQLAAYQLNKRGGVLDHWITLIIKDTHGTDEGARRAVVELAQENVFAIVGVHQSEAVLGAAEVAAENNIFLMVTTAAHPRLATYIKEDYAKYRMVFRLGKELSQWGDISILFLEKIAKAKNYYFIGYDAIWNHKLAHYLMSHCEVPCLGASFYLPGVGPTDKDMKKIKELNPDIVVNGDPGGTHYVLLHHQHGIPATIFSVGGALANANTIRTLGGAGDGLAFHCAYYDTSSEFYKAFLHYHGFDPLWYCDFLAYEAVNLIARALTKAGILDRDQLVAILEKGVFEGLGGTYQFDQNHQARWGKGYLPGYICQWHGDKAKVLYPTEKSPFVRK